MTAGSDRTRTVAGSLAQAARLWGVKVTVALLIVGVLGGCSAFPFLGGPRGEKYRYLYSLRSPIRSSKLFFKDQNLSIWFRIDDGAVRFKLKNNSAAPISIDWKNASLELWGKRQEVRSRSTYYAEARQFAPPRTIAPQKHIVDMAVPWRNVRKSKDRWLERDLIPTRDLGQESRKKRILRLKDTPLILDLPLNIGDVAETYRFEFRIREVRPVPWDQYRKPWRPPLPVQPKAPTSFTEEILVPAAVAAGMIGLTIWAVTSPKAPPSE